MFLIFLSSMGLCLDLAAPSGRCPAVLLPRVLGMLACYFRPWTQDHLSQEPSRVNHSPLEHSLICTFLSPWESTSTAVMPLNYLPSEIHRLWSRRDIVKLKFVLKESVQDMRII